MGSHSSRGSFTCYRRKSISRACPRFPKLKPENWGRFPQSYWPQQPFRKRLPPAPLECLLAARRMAPDPAAVFVRIVGRRRETCDFAGALGRLLQERALTVELIEAAGELGAAGNRQFSQAIRDIADAISHNGQSLSEALRSHPNYFDSFFCGLLATADTREQLRNRLLLLSRDAQPRAASALL